MNLGAFACFLILLVSSQVSDPGGRSALPPPESAPANDRGMFCSARDGGSTEACLPAPRPSLARRWQKRDTAQSGAVGKPSRAAPRPAWIAEAAATPRPLRSTSCLYVFMALLC
jgi:hypothetical protein